MQWVSLKEVAFLGRLKATPKGHHPFWVFLLLRQTDIHTSAMELGVTCLKQVVACWFPFGFAQGSLGFPWMSCQSHPEARTVGSFYLYLRLMASLLAIFGGSTVIQLHLYVVKHQLKPEMAMAYFAVCHGRQMVFLTWGWYSG